MRITRARQFAIATCAGIAAVSIASCATESNSTSGTVATSATDAANTSASLDTHNPAADAFYSHFRIHGLEVEYPKGLADAVPSASAVVLGTVLRVEMTRDFQGENPDDKFPYVGIVIEPELLAGALEPRFQETLTVEFMGGETLLAELKRTLPVGHQAIWFLRHKHDTTGQPGFVPVPGEEDYFRLVSSQGLFLQGSDRVAAPLAEMLPGAQNLATEGTGYQRVSDLVAKIRELAAVR